jgi:hypothetical protein
LRANMDLFVLFKFASYKNVMDGIYPMISGLLTEDEFKDLYEYSTKDKHDSFVIINHNMVSKGNSFRKNWDVALSVNGGESSE